MNLDGNQPPNKRHRVEELNNSEGNRSDQENFSTSVSESEEESVEWIDIGEMESGFNNNNNEASEIEFKVKAATTKGTSDELQKFKELFANGFPVASSYFSQRIEEIYRFIYAFTEIIENQPTKIDMKELLVWLMVCGRHAVISDKIGNQMRTPKEYLTYLQETHFKPSVCGSLFKEGSMVVTCKNCGMDPTCAICMPCFLASNHKGHDYTIHPSGGGVCDCGDPQAWQPSGFCTNHSGVKEDFDPSDLLPNEVVKSSRSTIRAVTDLLCEELVKYHENRITGEKDNSASIIQYISILSVFQQCGEAFRNFVARELGNTSTTVVHNNEKNISAMDLLLYSHPVFDSSLKSSAKTFYFQMISDYSFKRVFLKYYSKHYQRIYDDYVEWAMNDETGTPPEEREMKGNLLDIGVQLFTVPTLVLEMIKDEKLLDVLLKTISKIMNEAWLPNTESLDCNHDVISDSLFWRAYIDIKYVLSNKNVAQYVVYNSDLLSQILHIVSILQNMNQNTRKADVHIEQELPWLQGINLELNMLRWVEPLLEGYAAGPPNGGDLDENNFRITLVISYIKITMELWFRRKEFMFAKHKSVLGENIISYDLMKQPVSIHCTLHRFLAYFLRASQINWDTDITDMLKSNSSVKDWNEFIEMLLEEPLRVQAFLGQITAGLWVRNGASMQRLAYSYKCSNLFSHKTYYQDIFLIQFCAHIMGPKKFILTALDRFGLLNFFTIHENKKKEQNSKEITLTEEFLTFLTIIYTERSFISKTDPLQSIRRHIIHRLALGDQPHSRLVEAIPKVWAKDENFDIVLREVSNYQDPGSSLRASRALRQGLYSLKSECWKEFEGRTFYHYGSEELEKAMENYQEHIKKTGLPLFPKPWSSTRNDPLFSTFQSFDYLTDHKYLHVILFMVIYNHIVQKSSLISESHVQLSLILLYHCIKRTLKRPDEADSDNINANTPLPVNFTDNIFINLRKKVTVHHKQTTFIDLLINILTHEELKEQKVIINEIFEEISKRDEISKELIEKATGVTSKSTKQEKEDETSPSIKSKATEHQKRILAQFQAQQNAFLKASGGSIDIKDEKKEIELEVPECCLCRDISESYVDNPISLISYIQLSRNMELANRTSNKLEQLQPPPQGLMLRSKPKVESGVHLSNCGHYIHVECFQRYFNTLVQRHSARQSYEGRGLIDLEQMEFLCPTCRKLSNSLLPLVDQDNLVKRENKEPTLSKEGFLNWKSSQQIQVNPEIPKINPNPLNDAIDTLAIKTSLIKSLKKKVDPGEIDTTQLWSTISYTIQSAELQMRYENHFDYTSFSNDNSKMKPDLFYLISAAFQYKEIASYSILYPLWTQITSPDQWKQQRKENEEKVKHFPPLLTDDLFNVLIKLIYSWPRDQVDIQAFLYLLKTIYPIVVIQALISIYLMQSQQSVESTSKQGGTLENAYSVICKYLNEKQNLLVQTSDDNLVNQVKSLSLPWLRCAAIFLQSCTMNSFFSDMYTSILANEDDIVDSSNEYDKLLNLLQLPSLNDMDDSLLPREIVQSYIDDMLYQQKEKEEIPFNYLVKPRPMKLIELPNEFQDFLTLYTSTACSACNTVPNLPGVCLFCGELVCMQSQCCTTFVNQRKFTEPVKHMKSCGGRGIFFLPKECAILLSRRPMGSESSEFLLTGTRGTFFPSVYLDKYGEEDVGFRRGKPLFLEKGRYEQLRQLWLSHNFDDELIKRGLRLLAI